VRTERAPLVTAALFLGVGLGGFFDGILLHQILQWHNLLSAVVPPTDLVAMKYNMVWDGLFHAFTWVVTLAGVLLLWRAARRERADLSGRYLAGGMLLGWGLFNFIEGLIDHQLLGVHHVHPGEHQLAWDLGFLASGLALVGIGAALIARRGPSRRPAESAPAGAAPRTATAR
jgi:uncharacterized membrane protein